MTLEQQLAAENKALKAELAQISALIDKYDIPAYGFDGPKRIDYTVMRRIEIAAMSSTDDCPGSLSTAEQVVSLTAENTALKEEVRQARLSLHTTVEVLRDNHTWWMMVRDWIKSNVIPLNPFVERAAAAEAENIALKEEIRQVRRAWGGDTYGHLGFRESMDAFCGSVHDENERLKAEVAELQNELKEDGDSGTFYRDLAQIERRKAQAVEAENTALKAKLTALKAAIGSPLYHAAILREIDDTRKDETQEFLIALHYAVTAAGEPLTP